ncbi:MAG TPA: cell division protein FtsZ [Chitinophagaceae bacterium]|nr:cell division protein FtsZ [Chitinophagaceae bacterium]
MIHFDLPKEKSSILKVIGVGGGGGNAVNHMFSQQIDGVNFIICNTDAQALANSGIPNRVQLGPHLTQGLGAGANPEIGRQATEESLEEIKRILEVNTKMAFITAGMGGGTGTGGAPIIAKICKDLGILTVGIVTTPFAYEGKKRQLQAEEGIKVLKQYVDTLLVISNDKLRHQFGNLKMREAFEKADNVLATAAKCITDVINSTGQINVDFADVCTVMRNGGVAILGNAEAAGENRAHIAIEEALNSPLLNDNDIRGAKWILININSAEGDHEFTMDEVEIIQGYLIGQAGEGTDVILGMGYDNTLGDRLGITLIATGFEHKDPFSKPKPKKEEPKKEEKIVMMLAQTIDEKVNLNPIVPEESRQTDKPAVPELFQMEQPGKNSTEKNKELEKADLLAPRLIEETTVTDEVPMPTMTDLPELPLFKEERQEPIYFKLQDEGKLPGINTHKTDSEITVNKMFAIEKSESINSSFNSTTLSPTFNRDSDSPTADKKDSTSTTHPLPAAAGGYLARPSNIYAESKVEVIASKPSAEEPVPSQNNASNEEDELLDLQLQFVERDDIPAADVPLAHQAQPPLSTNVEDTALRDETEEQKRRAIERLQKLRNLSFNVNGNDPNNEFETVPAYIRRNMELYNNNSQVENFYSNYEVKTDQNNQTQISTINTFLDGKKPD